MYVRSVRLHRRRLRPNDPSNLEFLVDNVVIENQRHLLFATPMMPTLLAKAKKWYMDGTYKVVKAPFVELDSFHAFVKRDDAIKQVPLRFVFTY